MFCEFSWSKIYSYIKKKDSYLWNIVVNQSFCSLPSVIYAILWNQNFLCIWWFIVWCFQISFRSSRNIFFVEGGMKAYTGPQYIFHFSLSGFLFPQLCRLLCPNTIHSEASFWNSWSLSSLKSIALLSSVFRRTLRKDNWVNFQSPPLSQNSPHSIQ